MISKSSTVKFSTSFITIAFQADSGVGGSAWDRILKVVRSPLNKFSPVVRKNLGFLFSNLHRFADKIMGVDWGGIFLREVLTVLRTPYGGLKGVPWNIAN